MTGLIVTYAHLKTIPARGGVGWCNTSARPWFARYGLDWTSFVREGIPAEVLLATGCALAAELVEWARQCEAEACNSGR